ncbi:MAG: DUF5318 family protein [Acidimicrobiales bacterium]
MSFGPASVEGGTIGSLPGQIDYRLARNSVVREFRQGRLSRNDVCDAHPELLRVARHLGDQTPEDCPICGEVRLVHVSFVFGPRLPAGGRCVTSPAEVARFSRGVAQIACYVVEVCPACAWNHLSRMQVLGGRQRSSAEGS